MKGLFEQREFQDRLGAELFERLARESPFLRLLRRPKAGESPRVFKLPEANGGQPTARSAEGAAAPASPATIEFRRALVFTGGEAPGKVEILLANPAPREPFALNILGQIIHVM